MKAKFFAATLFAVAGLSVSAETTQDKSTGHAVPTGKEAVVRHHHHVDSHQDENDNGKNALAKHFCLDKFLTFEGTVGLYGQTDFNRNDEDASGEWATAYTKLKLETAEWQGLKLGVAGLFNTELKDQKDNYSESIMDRDALAELYLSYRLSETTLKVGRQAIDRIVLGDYFDGVTMVSNDIKDFEIFAAWVQRAGVLDPDEVTDFGRILEEDDTDGVYGTEVSYTGVEGLTLTGVYYTGRDAFDLYGAQAVYEAELGVPVTFMVESYKSNENETHGEPDDGSLFHTNMAVEPMEDLTLTVGYITAGEKGGVASLELNNGWDPFDEDTHTDLPGARSWYVSAEYQVVDGLTLVALYGETDHDTDATIKTAKIHELNAGFIYNLTDSLTLEAMLVSYDDDDLVQGDYTKIWTHLAYNF